MDKRGLLVIFVCALLVVASCHGESLQATDAPASTALRVSEARFYLATLAYTLVQLLAMDRNLDRNSKWRIISRVYPTYQLWRGHFSHNDQAGPEQVCRDWMSHIHSPMTEEEIFTCWTTMTGQTGDVALMDSKRTPSVTTESILGAIGAFMKLIAAHSAGMISLEDSSSQVVEVEERSEVANTVVLGKTCGALAQESGGMYDHVDATKTQCTGVYYGSICNIVCSRGYHRSRHYGHTVVCALGFRDGHAFLNWVPDGDAYQHMCEPDIPQTIPGLIALWSGWDETRLVMPNTATTTDTSFLDASYEFCRQDPSCSSVSAPSDAHLPVVAVSPVAVDVTLRTVGQARVWLDMYPTGAGPRSLRASVPTFHTHEITVVSVAWPSVASFDNIAQIHNIVQLDVFDKYLVDPTSFRKLRESLFQPSPATCQDVPVVLFTSFKSTGPTTGVLSFRINGITKTPDRGLFLEFKPNTTNLWETLVPLFHSATTYQSDKIVPLSLASTTLVSPLPDSFSVIGCVSATLLSSVSDTTLLQMSQNSSAPGLTWNSTATTVTLKINNTIVTYPKVSQSGTRNVPVAFILTNGIPQMFVDGVALSASTQTLFSLPYPGNFSVTGLGADSTLSFVKYAMTANDVLSLTCISPSSVVAQSVSTTVTLGHGGPTVPAVSQFNTRVNFQGKLSDVALYNKYLDPSILDQWNLRRIESLEWFLGSRVGMEHVLAPAKPCTPQYSGTKQISATQCNASLTLTPQGRGYKQGFAQQLVVKDQVGTEQATIRIPPGQTRVDVSLACGSRYSFQIFASVSTIPACLWGENVNTDIAGDSIQVLVG